MSLLQPWMALGILALAVPIIIHLLGRRRARIVRFAALDFLLGTHKRTRTSVQLRERTLLVLRLLSALALVVLFAQPFAMCTTRGVQTAQGGAAVLLFDDSLVSGFMTDGARWAERAKADAQDVLARLGPEVEVAVVRASEPAQHASLSRDHLRVRDELRAVRVSPRAANWPMAHATATALLRSTRSGVRNLYVFSPRRPPTGSNDVTLGDGTRIQFLGTISAEGDLTNVGITAIAIQPAQATGPRGIAVDVDVTNYGGAARDVELTLDLGNVEAAKGSLQLAAKGRGRKRFYATVPGVAAWAPLRVRLPDDALVIDNERWAIARLGGDVRVVLINGEPRRARLDDETFFADAALSHSATRLRTLLTADLDADVLAAADVAVCANAEALSSTTVAKLEAWVQAGGGLLIATGSNVDATAYQQKMRPLVPWLRDPVDVAWGALAQERKERALAMTNWDASHPIFAAFAPSDPSLTAARFRKITLVGGDANTTDRVIARYDNDAAALIERRLGAGRILVFTSTLDRDWNDLALGPGYLPLLRAIVQYLGQKHQDMRTPSLVIGESLTMPWGDVLRFEIDGPHRSMILERTGHPANEARTEDLVDPGIYEFYAVRSTSGRTAHTDQAVAVNIDPGQADLASPLPLWPAEDQWTAAASPPTKHRVELWHWGAIVLLVALLLEALLTRR